MQTEMEPELDSLAEPESEGEVVAVALLVAVSDDVAVVVVVALHVAVSDDVAVIVATAEALDRSLPVGETDGELVVERERLSVDAGESEIDGATDAVEKGEPESPDDALKTPLALNDADKVSLIVEDTLSLASRVAVMSGDVDTTAERDTSLDSEASAENDAASDFV
jgi:hypothetical protein